MGERRPGRRRGAGGSAPDGGRPSAKIAAIPGRDPQVAVDQVDPRVEERACPADHADEDDEVAVHLGPWLVGNEQIGRVTIAEGTRRSIPKGPVRFSRAPRKQRVNGPDRSRRRSAGSGPRSEPESLPLDPFADQARQREPRVDHHLRCWRSHKPASRRGRGRPRGYGRAGSPTGGKTRSRRTSSDDKQIAVELGVRVVHGRSQDALDRLGGSEVVEVRSQHPAYASSTVDRHRLELGCDPGQGAAASGA